MVDSATGRLRGGNPLSRLALYIALLNVLVFGATSPTFAQATTAPPTKDSALSAAAAGATTNAVRVCLRPTPPGTRACGALRLMSPPGAMPLASGTVGPLAAPFGFGPADLQDAYKLTALAASSGTNRTVAIVDAFDGLTAESDLAVYRATFGLPPCTTANGCFRKVNQQGSSSPLPTPNSGWASEISVDLAMVSAICPKCKILLVEASSNYDNDLGTAVNTAASWPGVVAISNSYGGPELSGDPTSFCAPYFKHPGIAITASSGDGGYGVEAPASCPFVTAVGGTSLSRSSTTARGWVETVWGSASGGLGAGSGCSMFEPKQAFQTDTACANRTVADVSAVANPSTGIAVYDQGSWAVYGGTSVSSPIIAAVFALSTPAGTGDFPVSYPYGNSGALFDVTAGANGSCGHSYLCTAAAGYDGPTGLGTPNGASAFGPAVASVPRVKTFTVPPCRVLDTRGSNPVGPIPANGTLSILVVGDLTNAGTVSQGGATTCGVPATATGVFVNVAAVNAVGSGYLTLYPFNTQVPMASTVNFATGQTIANGVLVPICSTGNSCPFALNVTMGPSAAHVVVDVTGYLAPTP
ncbi:MAG TPA: S53 family peptidase [Candidatus Methylomirabilis sp.]|nr:S53 family peptidase [Candidatus Methylomirabilis sp.]